MTKQVALGSACRPMHVDLEHFRMQLKNDRFNDIRHHEAIYGQKFRMADPPVLLEQEFMMLIIFGDGARCYKLQQARSKCMLRIRFAEVLEIAHASDGTDASKELERGYKAYFEPKFIKDTIFVETEGNLLYCFRVFEENTTAKFHLKYEWLAFWTYAYLDVSKVVLPVDKAEKLFAGLRDEFIMSDTISLQQALLDELCEAAMMNLGLKNLFYKSVFRMNHPMLPMDKDHSWSDWLLLQLEVYANIPISNSAVRTNELEYVCSILTLLHAMFFDSFSVPSRDRYLAHSALKNRDFARILVLKYPTKQAARHARPSLHLQQPPASPTRRKSELPLQSTLEAHQNNTDNIQTLPVGPSSPLHVNLKSTILDLQTNVLLEFIQVNQQRITAQGGSASISENILEEVFHQPTFPSWINRFLNQFIHYSKIAPNDDKSLWQFHNYVLLLHLLTLQDYRIREYLLLEHLDTLRYSILKKEWFKSIKALPTSPFTFQILHYLLELQSCFQK